jgi:hypothetical protein
MSIAPPIGMVRAWALWKSFIVISLLISGREGARCHGGNIASGRRDRKDRGDTRSRVFFGVRSAEVSVDRTIACDLGGQVLAPRATGEAGSGT